MGARKDMNWLLFLFGKELTILQAYSFLTERRYLVTNTYLAYHQITILVEIHTPLQHCVLFLFYIKPQRVCADLTPLLVV